VLLLKTLLPHISSSLSLQITPIPSPHTTLLPSPHYSPAPSASAPILKTHGSPIQVVEIGDEDSSSSEVTKSDKDAKEAQEEEKAPSSSRLLFQDPKNPFSAGTVAKTPMKKKMFSIESLGAASKVIGIESRLEDTLERKRKRKDESVPSKDVVSQAVCSWSTMVKAKKQKNLSILGKDSEIGYLTMEISKPNKVGRIKEMTPKDFTLHSIDLGEARHDTKVGLWRSGNEIIEGQLENLKLSKIKMKSKIEELKRFIRYLVVPLETITCVPATENPTTEEVQAFISQLQKD
jgi:hypothetical protein